jgi:hypothetical protein
VGQPGEVFIEHHGQIIVHPDSNMLSLPEQALLNQTLTLGKYYQTLQQQILTMSDFSHFIQKNDSQDCNSLILDHKGSLFLVGLT